MSSPEVTKVVGYIFIGVAFFAVVVWSVADMGFWDDQRDKEARCAWDMHKKYSPLWWQKFSRWLWGIALVLGVVGCFLSGPDPKQEPRPSLWRQLFSREK